MNFLFGQSSKLNSSHLLRPSSGVCVFPDADNLFLKYEFLLTRFIWANCYSSVMILLRLSKICRMFRSLCGVWEDVIHELLIGTKQRVLMSNSNDRGKFCTPDEK